MKLYAYIAAALFLFLTGMRVEAWRESYGQVKATEKRDKEAAHVNQVTQAHTLAAATRIQAISAGEISLGTAIATARFTLPTGDSRHAPSTDSSPQCPNPFSSDNFRLLYDAGSTGTAPKADDVPAAGP